VLIDFGPQPVCNRYLAAPDAGEYGHPLIFSQCQNDGLFQLGLPWPSSEVRPRLDWISYKEPERHLDDLCDRIAALPGVGPETLIAGLSYKDEPVLTRMEKKGYTRTWNVSLEELGIQHMGAGMETIQDFLSEELAAKLQGLKGEPGVIVVRHLLEHSNSVSQTMAFLKDWVAAGGYLVLEVPDSEQTLKDLDFGTVWEEHVCYFTEFTLGRAFAPFDTEVLDVIRYPYTLEDCLVAIVANRPASTPLPEGGEQLQKELALGASFEAGWQPLATVCQKALQEVRDAGGEAVIFGAGHRAATFVNLLGLDKLISCIIDDDPRKAGRFLPGCQLPIVTSAYLHSERPTLCLLAASPDSEKAIVGKNQAYAENGGRFVSIYPRSPLAWKPLKA
jgi:hypothetical protein